MAIVIVVCDTAGCVNEGVEIEVAEPDDPGDLENWSVVCGPCGQIIHQRDETGVQI